MRLILLERGCMNCCLGICVVLKKEGKEIRIKEDRDYLIRKIMIS